MGFAGGHGPRWIQESGRERDGCRARAMERRDALAMGRIVPAVLRLQDHLHAAYLWSCAIALSLSGTGMNPLYLCMGVTVSARCWWRRYYMQRACIKRACRFVAPPPAPLSVARWGRVGVFHVCLYWYPRLSARHGGGGDVWGWLCSSNDAVAGRQLAIKSHLFELYKDGRVL